MASFANIANAVRCAADIQRRFAAYNAEASESLGVRIGIDAGEPVEEHDDLFGATVQLATRLCSEAEAGDIVVSGFVRELCEDDAVALRGAWRASAEGLFRDGSGVPVRMADMKEE